MFVCIIGDREKINEETKCVLQYSYQLVVKSSLTAYSATIGSSFRDVFPLVDIEYVEGPHLHSILVLKDVTVWDSLHNHVTTLM